jgi:hypothetical protein
MDQPVRQEKSCDSGIHFAAPPKLPKCEHDGAGAETIF